MTQFSDALRTRIMEQIELAEHTLAEVVAKTERRSNVRGLPYDLLHRRIVHIYGDQVCKESTLREYLSATAFPKMSVEIFTMICGALQVSPASMLDPPSPDQSRYLQALAALDRRNAVDAKVYHELLEVVTTLSTITHRLRDSETALTYLGRVRKVIRTPVLP